MRSTRRFSLLAYNSAAALAGAVAMFAVVRTIVDQSPDTNKPEITAPASDTVSQSNRLTFLRPGIYLQPELPKSNLLPRPGVIDSSANTEAWSTEVRPESTTPQLPHQIAPSPPTKRQSRRPQPRKSGKSRARKQSVTLKSKLAEISPTAKRRLIQKFKAARAAWPPSSIAFVAIKDEKILELHARPTGGAWKLIHRYRVFAASGGSGPKLRQGDRQVPEGVYRIVYLNPRSAYHVSLRVNYPNTFDRRMAKKDGRKKLGGDIMIHGKNSSAGCLAMGDAAVEELFVLAAQTGRSKVKLIIAPTDLRRNNRPASKRNQPRWVPKLYTKIAAAMSEFKAPPRPTGLLSFFTQ